MFFLHLNNDIHFFNLCLKTTTKTLYLNFFFFNLNYLIAAALQCVLRRLEILIQTKGWIIFMFHKSIIVESHWEYFKA